MPSTGLKGSYPLTANKIDEVVTKISSGVYALGTLEGSTFYVEYVGRSDTDLNDRLKDHADAGKYSHFKYDYFTVKEAFEKECSLYHDFEPSGNKNHPDRPNGKNYRCPVCPIFD